MSAQLDIGIFVMTNQISILTRSIPTASSARYTDIQVPEKHLSEISEIGQLQVAELQPILSLFHAGLPMFTDVYHVHEASDDASNDAQT